MIPVIIKNAWNKGENKRKGTKVVCGGEMKKEKGKGRKMGMMLHTVIPIPAAQETAVRKCQVWGQSGIQCKS